MDVTDNEAYQDSAYTLLMPQVNEMFQDLAVLINDQGVQVRGALRGRIRAK